MMDFLSSETFLQEKWVKHLKICLKIRDSLLSPTQNVVARVTRGKQGFVIMDI